MCYSAMAEQNAKKIASIFKAEVSVDHYDDLFTRRLEGEKLYINKGLEQTFLKNPETTKEKAIAKKIRDWHKAQIEETEKALFAQKKRLADAIRILDSKPTKKAENDKRIATDKIEKFKRDLERHNDLDKIADSDSRIYPLHYVSMLTVDDKGHSIVMPVRYLIRPSDQDASFDQKYSGSYNARFDNLSRVAWWKNALGKRHGVMLVRRFYENVPTDIYAKKFKLDKETKEKKSIVLCFEPDNVEYMYIPMLWDVWKKKGESTLYSGALITDDPAPEVQEAGHDRTPIFLKKSAVDAWLHAKGTPQEIKEILQDRERPHYSHRVLGAA